MSKKFIVIIAFSLNLAIGQTGEDLNKEALKHYLAKNYTKAFDLTEKSCNEGNMEACSRLAYLYQSGEGVKKDEQKATELYEKACNNNNAGACVNMGLLYFHGKTVKQDAKKAITYFSKSCDLGLKQGCDYKYRLENIMAK